MAPHFNIGDLILGLPPVDLWWMGILEISTPMISSWTLLRTGSHINARKNRTSCAHCATKAMKEQMCRSNVNNHVSIGKQVCTYGRHSACLHVLGTMCRRCAHVPAYVHACAKILARHDLADSSIHQDMRSAAEFPFFLLNHRAVLAREWYVDNPTNQHGSAMETIAARFCLWRWYVACGVKCQ